MLLHFALEIAKKILIERNEQKDWNEKPDLNRGTPN
jgi:hypothetical protein